MADAMVEHAYPSESKELAVSEERSNNLLSAIIALAKDPTVDVQKLQALLSMQERMEARAAEAEFNSAFARLSKRLPRITKHGFIEYPPTEKRPKGTRTPYGKWEDIDAEIRPLLLEEGFALSFDTELSPTGGIIRVGILHHVAGHEKRTRSPPLPLDTSGGKNNVQAAGSTASYGNRYTTRDLLNLVFEGEDDDGAKGGADPITPAQAKQIADLIAETGASLDRVLYFADAETVPEIEKRSFARVYNQLLDRKRRMNAEKDDAT